MLFIFCCAEVKADTYFISTPIVLQLWVYVDTFLLSVVLQL
jgi:hypothetical protein